MEAICRIIFATSTTNSPNNPKSHQMDVSPLEDTIGKKNGNVLCTTVVLKEFWGNSFSRFTMRQNGQVLWRKTKVAFNERRNIVGTWKEKEKWKLQQKKDQSLSVLLRLTWTLTVPLHMLSVLPAKKILPSSMYSGLCLTLQTFTWIPSSWKVLLWPHKLK